MKILHANRYQFLNYFIKQGSVGAEIGVHRGDLSQIIVGFNPKKLYLIDCWRSYSQYDSEPQFNYDNHKNNLRLVSNRLHFQIENGMVEIINDFSVNASKNNSIEPLDWFYLDANHQKEFCLEDLIAWKDKLKPDGFIMGHDYEHRPSEQYGVIEAVAEFCKKYKWEIEYLCSGDTSYILKRKK